MIGTGPVNYGQVVYSIAGRDRGSFYIVNSMEKNMLYLVDGRNRKVENPKKKNVKHLQVLNYIAEKIFDKIQSGKKVTDLEVRDALKTYMDSVKKV